MKRPQVPERVCHGFLKICGQPGRAWIFAALATFTCPQLIAAPGETALQIFDAFLAAAAPADPDYRTDIRRSGEPSHPSEGRLTGVSPLVGPFTYRPKTYAELTRSERIELLRDGRLHDFLLHRSRSFVVTAEEMLCPDTLDIRLNTP